MYQKSILTKTLRLVSMQKKNKVSLNTLYFMNPHILTERIPAGIVIYAMLKE